MSGSSTRIGLSIREGSSEQSLSVRPRAADGKDEREMRDIRLEDSSRVGGFHWTPILDLFRDRPFHEAVTHFPLFVFSTTPTLAACYHLSSSDEKGGG